MYIYGFYIYIEILVIFVVDLLHRFYPPDSTRIVIDFRRTVCTLGCVQWFICKLELV